jgi:ribonucleoside-triphosphate reductase
MRVIKRNESEQDFCLDKIEKAIRKANDTVGKEDQMNDEAVQKVIATVQKKLTGFNSVKVEDIQDFVEQALVRHNKYAVAKSYILYRDSKKKNKKFTENEEKIIALIDGTSSLRGDNANKHIDDNASIRDYIAGIMCKSLANKTLPKEIIKAHNDGVIHWHDADYSPTQPLHNCDIYDLENMFKYGFVMGDTLIEPNDETPFRTMVNLAAQVALLISGRQYGGQTMSWIHLVPYIDKSRKIIRKKVIEDFKEAGIELNDDKIDQITERKVREEIAEGVKIYQYQILCHSSANGQTPFVSNNLCLREAQTQRELDDFAILIEEILKRRTKGVKDPSGHYISPLFPKLLYWTCDGLNVKKGDPYYYLTELAAKCISKRMQPDIVSEPQTRKHKQGQIIPCMGCRSLLGPIWEERTYPVDTKFFWTEGGTYPYEKFLDERTFESIPNGEYKTGYDEGQYCINFRGNTGWLIKKTDTEVVVKQPMVYGRWNNGVITINLPYVALESREKGVDFYENLDQWLELCRKAMQERVKSCRKIKAKNSPILWMYGALARLEPEQTVGDLMDAHPTRPTVSLGYVGLYETVMALIGESNTTNNGRKLSKEIMKYLNDKLAQWKKEDGIMYAIYGTPEESLTYKFALALRKNFGLIPGITDKDYVVNSYHVDPREEIDAFKKLEIEGEYLALSAGGAVSYVETADLDHNPEAIIKIIQWMHEYIIYAEVNRKIGICKKCGYEGDIELVKTEDGNFKFICPNCGNDDDETLDVTARICGYLGKVNAGNTNKGRLDDIYNRVIHTDIDENKDAQE